MHLEKHSVHCCSQNYPHLPPLRLPGSSRAAGAKGLGEVWTAGEAGSEASVCLMRVEWAGSSGHTDESPGNAQGNKWPSEFASLVNIFIQQECRGIPSEPFPAGVQGTQG